MSTSKQTREWYSNNAEQYARHVSDPTDSIYHAYYEKPAMQVELPDVRGWDVLSLGCGSGVDTQHLKDKGAKRAVGIDLTPELIEIAKRDNPQCEFHVMDMETLDFADESFGLVYSSLAIHYLIGGHEKALKEAYRVMKPGGILLFSDGHPVGSAFEAIEDSDIVEDRRLGIVKDKIKQTERVIGDYLTSRVNTSESWPIEYWHQPLSLTINQIIGAGFMLDKVVEFKPTEEMKTVNLRVYDRLMRIPEMLLYKARKP
jgi:ubiquinone/menaquinone biosynthesis C-methylase UbiE